MKSNTAYFGYRIKNFVPYAGLQFISAKSDLTIEDEHFETYSSTTISETIDEYEISANIFLPTIGTKFFIYKANKLNAYLNGNFSKPIITAKIDFTLDGDMEDDFENDIQDAVRGINIWYAEFGFGAEYFFDNNLSFSAEFGIRHFSIKYKNTFTREVYRYNTDTYMDLETDVDYKLTVSPTYAKFSLNFYFGRNE